MIGVSIVLVSAAIGFLAFSVPFGLFAMNYTGPEDNRKRHWTINTVGIALMVFSAIVAHVVCKLLTGALT